jgi:CRISPR-associated endoribonuclease Cas6
MRIKILVDVGDGITLPINYNYPLAGIIYRFLAESDPEYATFLHEEGYAAAEKRFKLFTFSQLMAERRRITGATIHFGSTLTWYIASPVERFLSHFADTLLTEGRLSIGPHQLRIKDVTVPRIPRFQSEMHFRCLSPITMSTKRERDGKQVMHYCLPEDPALSELIRQNLIRKHEAIHGHAPYDDALTFRYDANYISRRRGRVTRLVDYKGIKIRGVLCPFRVSGSPALIQTGYECGFGDKNSAGFGMAEV